jgi:hypothetical protein
MAATHKPNRSDEQGDDTNDKRETPKGDSMTVPQVPPSPTNPDNSAQCKYERTPTWEKVLAMVGVSAAVIYAGISLMMWCEMQKQTRIQRDTGINTERAWVGLDVPITLDSIETQSARVGIKGHYSIKNFGHGPAFKVFQSGTFVDTDRKIAEAEEDTACVAPIKFSTGTVPVGPKLKPLPPFGQILFPNQPKDEVIDFTGPAQVVEHLRFVGCAAYIDQFKSMHWTRFCMERTPGDVSRIPKLEFCALYNDTDEPKN